MAVTSVPMSPAARPLTIGAIALVLMLCASWGFNQIAVKIVLAEIPPFLQATIRSVGALCVILLVAMVRRVKLFERDGTLKVGIALGVVFGLEFVLIFQGLTMTTATRAVVFLYTAPFFISLGAYPILGERMRLSQWMGQGLCFLGVGLAIGIPQPDVDMRVVMGDLMITGGGAMWAATTLIIKASPLQHVSPEKGLGYQTAVSIPILGVAAWLAGEAITAVPATLTLALLGYQTVWVAGLTFLIWFGLIKRFSASKLSTFTFMTPLIGVIAGHLVMGDPVNPIFGVAALLVVAGLYLVNRPAPMVP